ncbi:prenyltransferase [Actinoplanes sp. OR16]|uniref:prenyltransferase/squalene oxidase repeat-containing protein n=1 Tax=Actinoplanes sp. OR16 TaxID=946334 RepID=UPI000F6B900B|nr:prenyltransferase/squalene oxidase repeat-containing protein [Actinoplanes sp. OR16]BBH69393.1 prenyltransferase [Actinoplanes sp. OR16]
MPDQIAETVASIAAQQQDDGLIPWYAGGQADPWDHVEAAMALDAGGEHERAAAAYDWLRRMQRPDGSWASRYDPGNVIADATAETNHAAYVAVGSWHHWLSTGDSAFLERMWPAVRRALDFVTGCQAPGGEIGWAAGDPTALLTGCSSIHQALRCGVAIATLLDEPQPDWELAADLLASALRERPAAFADKSRFSMDWYYPILGGAIRGTAALRRIEDRWEEFVVPGKGIFCVSDQPWVTGAETCELALALDAIGERDAASALVADMQHLREDDGSYWTGLVLTDGVRWPVERTTWTAAAVVLATDALTGGHPRSAIFRVTASGAEAAANPAP